MIAFHSDMIQLTHTIPIFILVSRIARTHQDFFFFSPARNLSGFANTVSPRLLATDILNHYS